MPKLHAKTRRKNPRTLFGDALWHALEREGISYTKHEQLGIQLAKKQEPARAIAYHPKTVESWIEGRLLPSNAALDAFEGIITKGDLDHLRRLHRSAQTWEHTTHDQPTELSDATKMIIIGTDTRFAKLVEKMDDPNSPVDAKTLPRTDSPLSALVSGKDRTYFSKNMTYFLNYFTQQIAHQHPKYNFPNLVGIHEQMLRERANEMWIQGVHDEDMGYMIRAMRVRLGEDADPFYRRVHAVAGIEVGPEKKASYVNNWETGKSNPVSQFQGQTVALDEALITTMKIADQGSEPLARSLAPAPWFDATKEEQFRGLYNACKSNRVKGSKIGLTLEEGIENIPPGLQVYAAQLDATLMVMPKHHKHK